MLKKTFDFSVGDPAGRPPHRLMVALRHAIEHVSANHYSSPVGTDALRVAVAGYYRRQHNVVVDHTKVAITQGARPAIYFALLAANVANKAVGYFSPAYSAFQPQITNAGMTPVPVRLPCNRLQYDEMMVLLDPVRGGAFIVNSPHNPTGRVFAPDELKVLVHVAREYGIQLISDFVYADLFQRESTKPLSLLTFDATAIEIISISKPFRACGWRIGAVVGNVPWVTRIVDRYATLNGVPFAFQLAAAVAWTEMPEVEDFRIEIISRRSALVAGLRAHGFLVNTDTENAGGMFVWAKVPACWVSADKVKVALARHHILVTAEGEFGTGDDAYLRFALNEPIDAIAGAVMEMTNIIMENDHGFQKATFFTGSANGRTPRTRGYVSANL